MFHACVIGQYASFTRAVVGHLHLNGFLFQCISIDHKKKNRRCESSRVTSALVHLTYSHLSYRIISIIPYLAQGKAMYTTMKQ